MAPGVEVSIDLHRSMILERAFKGKENLVELRGIEPLTLALRTLRSPN